MQRSALSLVLMLVASACPAADERNVSSLSEQLKNGTAEQSARAAQLLGELGPTAEPAVPQLIEALSDRRFANDAPFYFPVGRPSVGSTASKALVKIGSPAVPGLIRALAADEESRRSDAIGVLTRIGKPAAGALPHFKRMLEADRSDDVRYCALEAYAAIGSEEEEYPLLLQLALDDQSPDVRGLAAISLGELGPGAAPAVPALKRMLDDQGKRAHALSADSATERSVRFDAAEALGKIGPAAAEASDALNRLMTSDEDPEVRVSAALALFRLDNSNRRAMDALIAALGDHKDGSAGPVEAASALEELGPQAAPASTRSSAQ